MLYTPFLLLLFFFIYKFKRKSILLYLLLRQLCIGLLLQSLTCFLFLSLACYTSQYFALQRLSIFNLFVLALKSYALLSCCVLGNHSLKFLLLVFILSQNCFLVGSSPLWIFLSPLLKLCLPFGVLLLQKSGVFLRKSYIFKSIPFAPFRLHFLLVICIYQHLFCLLKCLKLPFLLRVLLLLLKLFDLFN